MLWLVGLLSLDTYEKGKQEVLDEQSINVSEEEEEKGKEEDAEDKPLLPPEVFQHLKTAAAEEKKEEKPKGICETLHMKTKVVS